MDEPVESEAPSRTKKKWLVLALAGIVLLGGAGVLAWQLSGKPAAEPAEAKAGEVRAMGLVAPEPFLANLADRGTTRFARITIRLVVGSEEEAKVLGEDIVKQARLRSAILELLSEQVADRLVTPEGKAELKKTVSERSAKALGCKVHDVLFTDFVVQF